MRIIIPGGAGQVGNVLARAMQADGHEVVVLSRSAGGRSTPWRVVAWDGRSLGDWAKELDGADVLINLAGRSVNCRYHATNRKLIMDSRIESTRVLGEALAACARPPRVWLQASTATIYAHRYDAANDELTGILGGHEPDAPDTWNFSIDVATAWERAASEAVGGKPSPPAPLPEGEGSQNALEGEGSNSQTEGEGGSQRTRLVLMRSAMTMSPDRGGIFATLLGLVRFGLGGKVGDGRQYVSWIHDQDFVRAVYWLIEQEELSGPVNLSSPNPLPYAEFIRTLREAWGARIGLPATKWMLEIGTFLMRSESELVLKSRRVVPTRLINSGFVFDFPTWPEAARNLCQRWRDSRRNRFQ
jgi:NAD dependent epimerase/dehydratase family enzyme